MAIFQAHTCLQLTVIRFPFLFHLETGKSIFWQVFFATSSIIIRMKFVFVYMYSTCMLIHFICTSISWYSFFLFFLSYRLTRTQLFLQRLSIFVFKRIISLSIDWFEISYRKIHIFTLDRYLSRSDANAFGVYFKSEMNVKIFALAAMHASHRHVCASRLFDNLMQNINSTSISNRIGNDNNVSCLTFEFDIFSVLIFSSAVLCKVL